MSVVKSHFVEVLLSCAISKLCAILHFHGQMDPILLKRVLASPRLPMTMTYKVITQEHSSDVGLDKYWKLARTKWGQPNNPEVHLALILRRKTNEPNSTQKSPCSHVIIIPPHNELRHTTFFPFFIFFLFIFPLPIQFKPFKLKN